jgi:catechol 2,3-dioxygenase-like lactoylglutathione lyase family enzyme
MIDHASFGVTDIERAGRFYDSVVGSLGWRRQLDSAERIAWGIVRPVFFVRLVPGDPAGAGHVCFAANGIPAVKAAWEGGVGAGGTDDGAPGPRPEYGASYYSAYLRDPDGNRVEIAVQSN